jgi:hypothetical protein
VPDWAPAFVNAGRAFVAIGAVELFWVVTAWPSGALAIVFVAIIVVLLWILYVAMRCFPALMPNGNVVLSCSRGNHRDLRGLPGGVEGIRTSDLRGAKPEVGKAPSAPERCTSARTSSPIRQACRDERRCRIRSFRPAC